jgi:Conserved oligomeric Golgi complex subunit 5, C-terminal/Conserved oligomeric Golgi complex subunit 5, N-terminal
MSKSLCWSLVIFFQEKKMASTSSSSSLEFLKKDAVWTQFADEKFNETAYAASVVSDGTMVAASLSTLRSGLTAVDDELSRRIVDEHETLLDALSRLGELDSELDSVVSDVDALQHSVARIRRAVVDPFEELQAQVERLETLHEQSVILRRVDRFLHLISRLELLLRVNDDSHVGVSFDNERRAVASSSSSSFASSSPSSIDLPRCASVLRELNLLCAGFDLSGVDVVEARLDWVSATQEQVMSTANRMLVQGLPSHMQSEVATALDVFYNLAVLPDKVGGTLQLLADKARAALRDCCSVTSLPAAASGGTGSVDEATLWSRHARCVDELSEQLLQVWHLERVLAKTRSPLAHRFLLDEVPLRDGHSMISTFWTSTMRLWRDALAAIDVSSAAYAMLARNYGRFRKLVTDNLLARLLVRQSGAAADAKQQRDRRHRVQQRANAPTGLDAAVAERTLQQCVFERFERAHVDAALRRIAEPLALDSAIGVSTASSDSVEAAAPSDFGAARVQRMQQCIVDEVERARCIDDYLTSRVASAAVARALRARQGQRAARRRRRAGCQRADTGATRERHHV